MLVNQSYGGLDEGFKIILKLSLKHCRRTSESRLIESRCSHRAVSDSATDDSFLVLLSLLTIFLISASLWSNNLAAQQVDGDDLAYKVRSVNESEFDHQSESFVKDWRQADRDYLDTEFGEQLYSEASTPTRLEILRLLSKETPSMKVFLHALSMGLDVETVLQAAIAYQPSKSRELANSAVNVLPILPDSKPRLYSSYRLEDLEREDETVPYSVAKVAENFFEQRLVLRPYPDWFAGQYHFLASAAELKKLQEMQGDVEWYKSKSTEDTSKRPIFVSLYESSRTILIDGEERIESALKENANALLPVVFIFNRRNERAVDDLGYPATIKGVTAAFREKDLLLTPVPEWQLGDYHAYSQMEEFYEAFDIPSEDDFEPEYWARLLQEAKKYTVNNTAFLIAILETGRDSDLSYMIDGQLYAAWDDPRSEAAYPYVHPNGDDSASLQSIRARGLVLNRPDLIAALNALNVSAVPVAFYYLSDSRLQAYSKGPQALVQAAVGAGAPPATFGGGGFIAPPPPPVVPTPTPIPAPAIPPVEDDPPVIPPPPPPASPPGIY